MSTFRDKAGAAFLMKSGVERMSSAAESIRYEGGLLRITDADPLDPRQFIHVTLGLDGEVGDTTLLGVLKVTRPDEPDRHNFGRPNV